MADLTTKLRRETSMNFSGHLRKLSRIEHLKEKHYYVHKIALDGDAPKEFIRAYFFESGGKVHKRNPRTWIPYIAKTAEKWYPHESVVEFMVNRIGIELGVNMNTVRLVQVNGHIRFLSRYFLNSSQMLIHGAEICGEFLQDVAMARQIARDRKTARELFTFEFIEEALQSQFPEHADEMLIDMVRMLAFDALVGRKASPRLSIEGDSNVNHFELISFIKEHNPIYKNVIDQISTKEKQHAATQMVKREFSHFFIPERNNLISFILNQRFEQIRSI